MPYRIFLAKYIQQVMGSSVYPLFTVAGTNCQYVGYCSDTLQKVTQQQNYLLKTIFKPNFGISGF